MPELAMRSMSYWKSARAPVRDPPIADLARFFAAPPRKRDPRTLILAGLDRRMVINHVPLRHSCDQHEAAGCVPAPHQAGAAS